MNIQNSSIEEWRLIPGWESYEVSTLGKVRRADTGKCLKTHLNDKGYPVAHLRMLGREKQIPVHTAMLTAFVGPKPPNQQAAHGDGNRARSILSNLRWATVRENAADRRLHGTQLFGEKSPNAILTEVQVREILSRPRGVGSGFKLAEEFGVSFQTISLIRLGKIWSHVQ